jgi:hypothetical protein
VPFFFVVDSSDLGDFIDYVDFPLMLDLVVDLVALSLSILLPPLLLLLPQLPIRQVIPIQIILTHMLKIVDHSELVMLFV